MLPKNPRYVGKPRQVILIIDEGLIVVTGDHAIMVLTLQQNGENEMAANKHPINTKESFGYNCYEEISKLKEGISNLSALVR